MPRIEHVALWTDDLETLVRFYGEYLQAEPGLRYCNPDNGFESVFLRLGDGARLEIMKTTQLDLERGPPGAQRVGLTHLALSVGSRDEVDRLTRRFRDDGYEVLDGPRETGDGYYESVVLDPDGNRLELTV